MPAQVTDRSSFQSDISHLNEDSRILRLPLEINLGHKIVSLRHVQICNMFIDQSVLALTSSISAYSILGTSTIA
jgi:hypothetical protein